MNITVENQELELNKLKKWIFGSKRESMPKEEHLAEGVQVSIFGEPEDEEIKKQVEEKTEEIIVRRYRFNK